MTGRNAGFITLCKKDDDPQFLSYHCIIHQEVLVSKRLNTEHIMDIAFKIINFIRGKSLQRRLFLMQMEDSNVDLVLHTDVRWLCRDKFLQQFWDLLHKILKFLEERGVLAPTCLILNRYVILHFSQISLVNWVPSIWNCKVNKK